MISSILQRPYDCILNITNPRIQLQQTKTIDIHPEINVKKKHIKSKHIYIYINKIDNNHKTIVATYTDLFSSAFEYSAGPSDRRAGRGLGLLRFHRWVATQLLLETRWRHRCDVAPWEFHGPQTIPRNGWFLLGWFRAYPAISNTVCELEHFGPVEIVDSPTM